jgi:hypothetical protein
MYDLPELMPEPDQYHRAFCHFSRLLSLAPNLITYKYKKDKNELR